MKLWGEAMTREKLKNISDSVKRSFAKILSFNGYSKVDDDYEVKMELLESFCDVVGQYFKFGEAYENVKFLENDSEVEEGIATIEANGLSYRSFINLKDGSSIVFKSIYVCQGEKSDESYISARFFSEDQSLFVVNAKTKGKRNIINELCLSVYASEEIMRCFETVKDFNPCEIGENIGEHIHPSKILILLASNNLINGDLFDDCLKDIKALSEVLILAVPPEFNGEIPYVLVMNSKELVSILDNEKKKRSFVGGGYGS